MIPAGQIYIYEQKKSTDVRAFFDDLLLAGKICFCSNYCIYI